MFHPIGTTHIDHPFLPLQVFPLAWDRNEVSHLSRCCGQELTQGQEPKGRESSHGAQALPLSSGAAKPFLLRGPADPSSSSRVSAYRAETPRLQINLWLQLEPGERGRAWRRGGGRRRGSSRQSRAEQLIHALLGSPSLLLQEPMEGLDWETGHRSKTGILQLQIQSCSLGLTQDISQSPSPPRCWTTKKQDRVSFSVPEVT